MIERINRDDEIVASDCRFHMERMDKDHVWFQVDGVAFDLVVKRGKLMWTKQTADGGEGSNEKI